MKFKPLADRILVRRSKHDETSKGGIIIPDIAKDKPTEGLVMSVGPGKRLEDGTVVPVAVSAGDTILFGKYSGSDIKVEGEELLIVREDDVLGIVEK